MKEMLSHFRFQLKKSTERIDCKPEKTDQSMEIANDIKMSVEKVGGYLKRNGGDIASHWNDTANKME
jgi:hypothetical protein